MVVSDGPRINVSVVVRDTSRTGASPRRLAVGPPLGLGEDRAPVGLEGLDAQLLDREAQDRFQRHVARREVRFAQVDGRGQVLDVQVGERDGI